MCTFPKTIPTRLRWSTWRLRADTACALTLTSTMTAKWVEEHSLKIPLTLSLTKLWLMGCRFGLYSSDFVVNGVRNITCLVCPSVKLTQCIWRPSQVCQSFLFFIFFTQHSEVGFLQTRLNMYGSSTVAFSPSRRSLGPRCWKLSPICCTSLGSHWQSTCISITGAHHCCKKDPGTHINCRARRGGSEPPFSTTDEGWMVG